VSTQLAVVFPHY